MAGQVGKLILETGIKGFEEVQELGKGLQQIAKLTDKTDRQFIKAAKSVKDFAGANRNSVNAIRGQIVALNKLKDSATIGGKAYKSLAADIVNLNTQLLTLSNVEKVAVSNAAAAAQLPARTKGGRLVGDQRLAGTRSLAGLGQAGSPLIEKVFTDQVAEMNAAMSDLGINTGEYAKILKTLIGSTRDYNAALANQTAKQGSIDATQRIRAAGRSKFTIGTSSQGYNPYTTFAGFDGSDLSKAGRPFVEGLPVQGPFGLGPKRTAYMKRPGPMRMFEAFMESTFPKGKHSAFREALKEPLVPPMGFGPGGAVGEIPSSTGYRRALRDKKGRFTGQYDYNVKKGDKGAKFFRRDPFTVGQYSGEGPANLGIPKSFVKSPAGFDAQINSYKDLLKDLVINGKESLQINRTINKLESEKQSLIKQENQALSGTKRTTGPRGSRAARGLTVGADGTFIGQAGPTRKDFGPFKAPEVKKVAKSVEELTDKTLKNTAAGKKSINALTKQRAEFEKLRGNLDPTSKTFARLTKEIAKTDKALLRLSNNKFSGANLRRTGQSILGAGFVGGPAGFLGAGLGAGIEALRPGGDMAGGAITGGLVASQVLTPVSQAIGGATTYASDIEKANIALRGITKTTENYEVAQAAITKAVEVYNVPQEVAIKGMTRLSAAVLGAGGNIHNATEAFLNTTVAIKGTAGSADDVKSAITAMVQIFSKGKVSAEELSGQLGERFPAAVTKFAKANNISTQELQKNLKDGTVGLDQLSKFITSLGKEYEPLARKIAESNEEAGARSQIAMNKMKIALGDALRPIGANFQIIGAQLLTDLIPAIESLALIAATVFKPMADIVGVLANNFELLSIAVGLTAGAFVGLAVQQVVIAFGALNTAIKAATVSQTAFNLAVAKNKYVIVGTVIAGLAIAVSKLGQKYKQTAKDIKDSLFGQSIEKTREEINKFEKDLEVWQSRKENGHWWYGEDTVDREIELITKQIDARKEFIKAEEALANASKAKFPQLEKEFGSDSPFVKFAEDLDTFNESLQNVAVNGFKKLEDSIMQFVTTGKLAIRDLVTSVLHDLTRLMIRQTITKPLFSAFTSALTGGGGKIGSQVGNALGGHITDIGLDNAGAYVDWSINKNGNAFAKNGIVPYRKGGVVNRATMFKYGGSQLGIMGEAGPEAVLPLQRGRGGRLGVAMQGGGGTTNVNYTGPTLNFNGDEYVPKSAVGGIINAASNRGASMGETRAIRSLQNNRSARGRLGM